jgi:hypothetical protein
MKYLLPIIVVFFNCATFSQTPLNQRPSKVQEKVSQAHKGIIDVDPRERWGNYGKNEYYFMNLDDFKFIDYLIKTKIEKKQKVIRFMDFGAGVFSWPLNLASYLKKNYEGQGLKFEVVGITGDKPYSSQELNELIKTNSNDIVDLKLLQQAELESIGKLFPKNYFDLIVSAWTFVHLVDPFGTLYQLYGTLNEGGFLFFEGFPFHLDNGDDKFKELPHYEWRKLLESIFKRSNASFIGHEDNSERKLDQFLLQKPNKEDLKISIEYSSKGDTISKSPGVVSASIDTARYVDTGKNYSHQNIGGPHLKVKFRPGPELFFYGNRNLLDLFIKRNLFLHQKDGQNVSIIEEP